MKSVLVDTDQLADSPIGEDYYDEIVIGEKQRLGDPGLFLENSRFGQLLVGATPRKGLGVKSMNTYVCTTSTDKKVEYSLSLLTYLTKEIPELQMFSEPDAALKECQNDC